MCTRSFFKFNVLRYLFQTVSVNLPEDAQAKGRCGSFEKEAMLELSWPGFRLVMIFTFVSYNILSVFKCLFKIFSHLKSSTQNAYSIPFFQANAKENWEMLSMELLYNTASPIFDEATNGNLFIHSCSLSFFLSISCRTQNTCRTLGPDKHYCNVVSM